MYVSGDVLKAKLDFWIKNNQNVLLIGRHGVGKTAMIEAAFKRNNLKYKYFSASTMDPWVDFIGVPKEKTENDLPDSFKTIKELAAIDESFAVSWIQKNWSLEKNESEQILSSILKRDSGLSYLELIKPYEFANGSIEAIFFDEFNRSQKKVRNAVMELIQFKSINGIKLPKLKVVWAAINPEDEDIYDVEKLDPAQLDRFHIHWEVPYKPDVSWFASRYGERMAGSAIQWWEELPDEEKLKVTPRRLEYALEMYINKGDIRDVLPVSSNASKLLNNLTHGPVQEKLELFLKSKNKEEAIRFLSNENNYFSAMKLIEKSKSLMEFFVPLLPKEKIASLIHENDKIYSHVVSNSLEVPVYMQICKQILETNSDSKLVKKIRRFLTENQNFATRFAEQDNPTKTIKHLKDVEPWFNTDLKGQWSFNVTLAQVDHLPQNTIEERKSVFFEICKQIPEKLSVFEANKTLAYLNLFAGKDEFLNDNLKIVFGITKHCLMQKNQKSNPDLYSVDVLLCDFENLANLLKGGFIDG